MLKKMFTALAITATLGFAATTANAQSLADILTSDGDRFDTNQNDFDIVTEAVIATGLAGAADSLELTAFLPTDKAFRILVEDLYGISIKDEEALFNAIVATLTPAVVEQVLLYHLVGGTVAAADVIALGEGFMVPTLLGPTFTIDFKGKAQIRLVDGADDLRDPIVRQVNIFADNGVAHVIDRVLLPPMD